MLEADHTSQPGAAPSNCEPLRVVLVEDSLEDAALLTRALEKSGLMAAVTRVESSSELELALRNSPQLVISDFNLPGFDAFGALEQVSRAQPHVPFIVISGAIGEATAVQLMRAGAKDVVAKGEWSRLAPAIRRELAEAENRQRQRRNEAGAHLLSRLGLAFAQSIDARGLSERTQLLTGEFFGAECLIEPRSASGNKTGAAASVLASLGSCVLPLVARGEVVGKITCSRAAPFRPDELALLAEIGSRLSQALDNAELFHAAKQAIRLRDEFLSIASHELKTPITAMVLQAQLRSRALTKGVEPHFSPDRLKKMVSDDLRHLARLTHLIDEMLDISRIRAGKLELQREPMDLTATLRETVARLHDFSGAQGATIEIQAPETLSGSWDVGRIEQVITNLITNALKYGEGKPIQVSLHDGPEEVTLVVSDSGMGISPQDQERIFKRFERIRPTSSTQGLGLGLYILSEIVNAHGGTVAVESELGHGARFRVRLPRSSSEIPSH